MMLGPSPVVAVNRAAAVAMREGAASGLSLLDGRAAEPLLRAYHPYYVARADRLQRLGRVDEAAVDYRTARSLAGSEPERAHLRRRLAGL
jgi:RNA polymerase sigma-70 factor (ECF subfamily)